MDMLRKSKHIHEKKHREFRKRQKKAIDAVLDTTQLILDWPDDQPLYKTDLWRQVGEARLLESISNLNTFKLLEERGYGDICYGATPAYENILLNSFNCRFR